MTENLIFREGTVEERPLIAEFLFKNHVDASARNEEERKDQTDECPDDFPDLVNDEIFKQGKCWIILDQTTIVGGIGYIPDTENSSIVWISWMGVAPSHRGLGLGDFFFYLLCFLFLFFILVFVFGFFFGFF